MAEFVASAAAPAGGMPLDPNAMVFMHAPEKQPHMPPAPMYMYPAPHPHAPQRMIHAAAAPPCKFFQRGFCRNGMMCRFAHIPPTPQQLAAMASGQPLFAPTSKVTTPCRYWLSGTCRFGDKCHFAHNPLPGAMPQQMAPAPSS